MTTQEILNQRNEKGILSFNNEVDNWYAISRDNTHIINFNNKWVRIYKNEKSFAIRVSQLMNRGY
jgi:hypothetical protein